MGPSYAVLRHVIAIAVLPFTVTVLIPIWIARGNGLRFPHPITSPAIIVLDVLGVALLAIGLRLFTASLRRFAVEGQGTLAPWDPPRNLVVAGPYRFVRNPMISGVVFVLFGEACLLTSWPHAEWALAFLLLSVVSFAVWEEPQLRRRFGKPYREYCRNVGRLIPRLTPWVPGK